VGDSIGEVDGAVDGVNNPAVRTLGVPARSFLSKNRDFREDLAQRLFDLSLTANIELELEVVLGGGIDAFGTLQIATHDGPGSPGRANSRMESPPLVCGIHHLW
jgi:hypothetical protein